MPQTQGGTQLPSLGGSQCRLTKCPGIRPELDDVFTPVSPASKLDQPSLRNRSQEGELVTSLGLSNLDECLNRGWGIMRSFGAHWHPKDEHRPKGPNSQTPGQITWYIHIIICSERM